ncbi:unnamed protein product, partial [Rotaria magnacalcarata]
QGESRPFEFGTSTTTVTAPTSQQGPFKF